MFFTTLPCTVTATNKFFSFYQHCFLIQDTGSASPLYSQLINLRNETGRECNTHGLGKKYTKILGVTPERKGYVVKDL
jgi:hypothetical protein